MKYRGFRHNGQVLDAIFGTDGEFSVPPESHVADLARALGVPDSEISVFESDTRPTPEKFIPPTVNPPSTQELARKALRDATTLPQLKAAMEALLGP
jgi:hypothetical protein